MKIISILIAGMLLLSGQAIGQDHRNSPATPAEESTHYGWADVLRVDPVYDQASAAGTSAPHEECYEEQVIPPQADDTGSSKRTGATVFGAIIGGLIGNRFGKGDGRKAATAAGAVAGGIVGNNLAANSDVPPPPVDSGYTTQRHCRQVDSGKPQRRIIGYDIEYRYRGEIYMARTNYDPGDRMRVRVSVMPAE